MSKGQTDTHLRFGQGVIIRGYKPQPNSGEGIMTVRGFADVRANYQTISDILYFKNYRNGIFQFLPAGNFQINDELYKLKSKIIDSQEERQEIARTVQTLQARAKSQQNQFQLSIKRNKKTTIKFGDYIMLRHVDSETYLSGTIRASQGTNGAFSVEVSDRLSSSLIFQLLPYRSFQAESMQIPYSSPVLIKNVYNNGYLTFEKLGILKDTSHLTEFMKKVPTSSDQSYKIPVKTATQNSQIYEVVTHFVDLSEKSQVQVPMPWIFQMHFKQVENQSLIQHDIVYLQHTKNNGILSAIGLDIVLKQSKSSQSEGLQFYQSLWEIQKYQAQRTYILRHLMSGMTLGVKKKFDHQKQEQVPETAILVDISKGPQVQLGFIELQMAKKNGGQINSESYVYILTGDYTLDINQQQQKEIQQEQSCIKQSRISQNNSDIINLKKMKKLIKNQLEFNACKLKFTAQISKNCFIIQQIDDNLKKQLLFALSFHSTIINLRQDLKWGATDAMKKVSYLRMMKVTEKIAQINDFLKDCSSNDPDKEFKQPVYKRQMICKDLGLSQLLFELLFYIRQNIKQQIFKEKVNQREKFYEMHQKIYEVIINLVKNNKVFKIHVSKWLIFVLEDFIEKGKSIHYQALLQILKDNQFFLQNFINSKIVNYLFQSMLKQRNPKNFTEKRYIDVLRAFCMVGDKVYSANQGFVLKNFFQRLQSTPEGAGYMIKFYLKDGCIYCRLALDKKNIIQYKFEQFKTICKEVDANGSQIYPNSWQYFTAYLNLLADITKGRNKSVEKYVAKQLPLSLLSQLFINYDIGEFEVPVIKIIHYLYSQNQNFYPIDKQNRIVSYDFIDSQKVQEINHFSGSQPPQDMQNILRKLIQKLSQAGPILPRQIDESSQRICYKIDSNYTKNQILIQILKMTRQTLNLGFWVQRQDLKQIFTHVMKILEKHQLIDYNEVTKISPENELMTDCKIQCLNIINMLLDQDMSTSLKICNKAFRQFEFHSDKEGEILHPKSLTFVQGDYTFAKEFINSIQQKSQQILPIVDSKIYKQIVQLSHYNNSTLTSKSLAILHRILNFKKHRIQKFYSQLFVCQSNCVKFAQFLTELKNKFFILEDINTTKITYENQSENYFSVYQTLEEQYKPGKNTSLMHDLYIICQLMKNESCFEKISEIATLDSSGIFNKLGTDCLLNFVDCRKSTNIVKQKIVYAANIHLKVLQYIINCDEVPQEQLALKLLHLCYYFIVSLIENHQEVKTKIAQYIPYFLRHLSRNVGCIDVLKQLYDNNKNMLFNQAQLFKLIHSICEQIESQQNLFYKAKLLDFFRYLIYLNNKCLQNNQIQILKIMQDDDFSHILVDFNVSTIKNLVNQYNQMNDFGAFQSNHVKCSPQLIYLSSYLQVINSLIDKNNNVNIGKLIKRFPFDLLTQCILACQNCWILKRNLRAIINRMYYFSVGTNVYLSSILCKEIPSIIDDLDRFILAKNKGVDELQKQQGIKYENPVRFNYLQSYLYLNLQQNFFTLFSLLDTEELYNQLEFILKSQEVSSDLSLNLLKIGQRIGYLKGYFKNNQNIYLNSFMKFLQSRLIILFQFYKIAFFQQGFNQYVVSKINLNINNHQKPDKQIQHQKADKQIQHQKADKQIQHQKADKQIQHKKTAKQIQQQKAAKQIQNKKIRKQIQNQNIAKNYLIQKILNGQIAAFYKNKCQTYKNRIPLAFISPKKVQQDKIVKEKDCKRLSQKLREIFTKKKKQFEDKDQQINKKMQKIVQGLKMSKQINREYMNHFEALFSSCYLQNYQKSLQQLQQVCKYITILIKINQDYPQCLSEELKIFILKLIVSLFYDVIRQKPKDQQNHIINLQQKITQQKVQNTKAQNKEQQHHQIDQWKATYWQKKTNEITNLQNQLMNCGLGSFLTSLIKGCNNIQLANQILLCSIAYMLGGNPSTQNNIKEQLSKDSQNKLLINIKTLIYKLGGLIRKNLKEQKSANKDESSLSQFFINWTDNYEFYDKKLKFVTRKNVSEPHYVDEIIYYEACIVTYRRAFKFLQLLCENNNIENKNFIREQVQKPQSIDFIQIATKELRNIFQYFCKDISELPIYILDFIMQVTQIPVKLNQQALIKSSFFEDCCELAKKMSKKEQVIERGFQSDRQSLNQIFQKCVQIILSNFQGNDKDYFMNLDRKLDPDFLINIFNEKLKGLKIKTKADFDSYIQNKIQPKINPEGKLQAQTTFDDKIIQILQIIIIFLKLRDVVGEKSQVYTSYLKQKQKHNSKNKEENLLNTLQNSLLHIQIADENNSHLNIYFPNHPFFNSLTRGLKDYIMSAVQRQTHRGKIVSLLGYVQGIRQKITQSYNFEKCYKISEQQMTQYYSYSAKLSLFICLYMTFFYNVYIEYGSAEFTSTWPVVIVRLLLSLLQLKYCFLFVKTWYRLNVWVNPQPQSRQNNKVMQIISLIISDKIQDPQQIQQKKPSLIDKLKDKANQKLEYLVGVVPYLGKVIQVVKQTKQQIFPSDPDKPKVYHSGQFYKNLVYLLVSFFGAFIYPPIIFLHLIDMVCSNKVLGNIFQAIRLVAQKLFLVSMLGVAFTIVFSSITFNNYVKDVYADAQDENQMCTGPFSCILALFVSGAIGETMSKFEIVRFTFDLIYAIFFGLLFGNIISTLMLDAFGELDSSNDQLQQDKKNYCYICNVSRQKLQKNSQKFEDHTTKKHFLWNYIFYIIALQKKNETDYTGMQYYISQKYNLPDQEMDVNWIPNGQQSNFETQEFTQKMLTTLDTNEQEISQQFKGLQLKIDEFTKLAESLHSE